MKTCDTCGNQFNPSEKAPYARQCFTCWKANKPKTTTAKPSGNNRSFALSYAKDLVVAGKLETTQMFVLADKMNQWLEGGDNDPQGKNH